MASLNETREEPVFHVLHVGSSRACFFFFFVLAMATAHRLHPSPSIHPVIPLFNEYLSFFFSRMLHFPNHRKE
jgi:hypothetical protein